MTIDVMTLAALATIIVTAATPIFWGMRQIMCFFYWLESMLPAKLMFVAFGIAFAFFALLQIRGLDLSYPVPQLQSVFQVAALTWFAGAILSCALAILVTLGDGVIKYANRTRYYYYDYPHSNDRHW